MLRGYEKAVWSRAGLVHIFEGHYAAAAHDAAGLDFEEIREIAADHDLQVEPHSPWAVVGDVDVFVEAGIERAGQRHTQDAGRNCCVLGRHLVVREHRSGRIVIDGPDIQQSKQYASRGEVIYACDASIEEEQTLVCTVVDLAVGLAGEH